MHPQLAVIPKPFTRLRSSLMKRILCVLVCLVTGLFWGMKLNGGEESRAAADPAATKLLSDARAARALYHDFPGFRAVVEVNHDGKRTQGQVEVSEKGKVVLKIDNADAAKWAKHTLE